jgi:YYY domain-containing protein
VAVQPDEERGGFEVTLLSQLPVLTGERYRLILAVEPQGGVIALNGQGLANEGEWDDGLPLRLEGYDGFGGIYPQELNFNMYWDDNPDKLERFVRILDEADTLVISSNRQWGSLPRIPERFPLTTAYYRNLIGCPESQSIETCYRVAQPGQYHGNLGFDLAQVFESNPRIGPFSLNDQFAEEAFTVYDHPKVLVFQKRTDYDPEKVREILGSVDFSQIIRKPPLQYDSNPADLMLPEGRWAAQQQAGTWAELFDTQAPQNRYPILSVLVWYLSLSLLGLLTYPILRRALPGLPDHGYPLARTAGMLLLSYLVWLAGSLNIPFTRPTISLGIGLLAAVGILLAYQQRTELRQEWKAHQRYFWIVEALLLGLFLAFLVVRIGNPDLWHPWKGGEKPMDFSYFNAVLKSTSFPPYDPWFAGGYLNYYYYGFVLVGVLVKWLGIVPATAYNLILPTLFSLIAMGAFSLSWNLSLKAQASRARPGGTQESRISPYIPALAAALGMAILGNQGTVKMIYQGYQKLAAPGGMIEEANLATRLAWAVRGFLETLQGQRLPYGIGDWYWLPSRIIPGQGDIEPITEFPYFTVLYADLHAHLVALPLTLLALTFIVGLVLGKGHWKGLSGGIAWFLMAGLALGALRPTNTWDLPPYLALGVIGVFYTFWSYSSVQFKASPRPALLSHIHPTLLRWLLSIGGAALLVGLTFLLYQPYAAWYALGYTQIGLWEGSHTPLSAYLSHWGLFLVVILPWMAWDTRDWLAKTPLSGLRKLKPYQFLILFSLALLILATAALQLWQEVAIAWLVLPAAAWAGVLILRPNMPDAKRIVLFLIGSGFMLTLMVEAIVLRGDIGRMNTVFKFYLQVWTMFSISAAAALGWLWPALEDWSPGWRYAWQAVFAVLVAGASLYPITATMAKIEDRMAENAPHTLDGMAFIPYSTYTDEWGEMQLDQDYKAIRWLQENVEGSPVIVEANLRNLYRWGSRYTIYTGLPGVVGWEWHQQQQRAVTPGIWVSNRIKEIDDFYLTTDLKLAADFLKKYNVKYIIVGQQERGHYPGPGLAKFEQAEGILWQEVYSDGDTAIYKVIEAPS